MEIIAIEESVCPRCKEAQDTGNYTVNINMEFIDVEGHCTHVYPRSDGTYLYSKDSIEEEES